MKSKRARLLEDYSEACESYWRSITEPGWSADHVSQTLHRVAQVAVRRYLFEQGFRAGQERKP